MRFQGVAAKLASHIKSHRKNLVFMQSCRMKTRLEICNCLDICTQYDSGGSAESNNKKYNKNRNHFVKDRAKELRKAQQ